MTTIKIPRINQSATEAVLIEWLAAEGEEVKAGQPIALIETDKSEIEVESPTSGIFNPEAKPGETYQVGQAIATIVESAGAQTPRVHASPKARRIAREQGIDLSAVVGDQMITAADVAGSAPSQWQGRAVRERRRLDPTRQRVAQATSDAWKVPHFVQMIDVDLTKLSGLRPKWRDITWTTLFVAALAKALSQTPELNAAVDRGDLILFDSVNIGVAVDTDRGLLVPVIADADKRTLKDLAAAVKRANDTHAGDPVGASATVSNLGVYGIRAGTPVLNSPEPVLLFAGAVEDRAIVVDNGIAIRTMVTLSLAFDHRVTDGAPAARFAASVRQILEHPEQHL